MQTAAGDGMRWYAVQMRSNFENRVAAELGIKGIENYLPAFRELHQWKDRKRAVNIPMFPGYVFARFCDQPDLRWKVLTTPGVVRILGHGGIIEAVPDEEIDAVRRLLLSKLPCSPHRFLRKGDRVRVKRGVLTGIEGILVRTKNSHRLVITVQLLSRSVAAEIDQRDVEHVGKQQAPTQRRGALCTRI